jgi:hypothetical protein
VKLALLFLALLTLLSLLLGEVPLGEASGCVLLPLTMVLAIGGAFVVIAYAKERIAVRVAWALLMVLFGFHICGGPLYYRGARIESRVGDAQGDPVADADVVATWETNRGRLFARVAAKTDRGGSFVIEPWGPRLRPPLEWLVPGEPTLAIGTPPFVEREESPRERVAAVTGEQWHRSEIVVERRVSSSP